MTAHLPGTFQDILDGVRAQPARIGLSFMALGVGITALTILVAILRGLEARSRALVEELGANVIAIVKAPAAGVAEEPARLRPRYATLLAANLPDCGIASARQHTVPTPGTDRDVTVVACDDTLCRVRGWRVTDGRFLDRGDLAARDRHAVITEALGRQWNWRVGDVVTLKTMPFRVVGIVATGSGGLEGEPGLEAVTYGTRTVFVPSSLPPAFFSDAPVIEPELDALFIRVPEAARLRRVLATAQRLLSQPDGRVSGLCWVTPETLLGRIRRLQNTIKLSVGSIAVLCLALGGTTLMSLMVANVRDRVTEIGLRRALGATPRDIALLFVLEATVVTIAAGLAGTLVTLATLFAARTRFPVPLGLGPATLLLPLAAALLLGAAFSFWPARAAARITPSEALRND